MSSLADFRGVWERIVLYEPKGELGPVEEQRKNVIWVQSSAGLFVDIRYEGGIVDPLKMKSFAGSGSYDSDSNYFTWTRDFDFRPAGAPDVGSMRVLQGTAQDPLQLEEDGVLTGDDYREIWDKLPCGNVCVNDNMKNDNGSDVSNTTDCAARLTLRIDGVARRGGIFLVVGSWFAVTLSRDCTTAGDGEASLKQFFSGEPIGKEEKRMETDGQLQYLWDYTAAMGGTAEWKAEYALHEEMRGQCISSLECSISALFDPAAGWEWELLQGSIPASLLPLKC